MDGSRYWLKMKTHYCWLLGFWLENLCGFNNTLYLNGAWELEKTLESPLDCKEIQAVHSKGGQSWVFIGRNDCKAETPILWPPHVKSWLIGKDPDAGKGLEAGGEGDDRGWDGWMASLTWWTWVWVNSGSWSLNPWITMEVPSLTVLDILGSDERHLWKIYR